MNSVYILFFFLTTCTAQFYIDWIKERQNHDVIDRDDYYWFAKTTIPVNRPSFPAYIRFYNTHTAQSEYEIDCSRSSQILYYSPPPQIIFLTRDHFWVEGDSYFLTFDEGVFYSNSTHNSTAIDDPTFWHFTVVRPLNPSEPAF